MNRILVELTPSAQLATDEENIAVETSSWIDATAKAESLDCGPRLVRKGAKNVPCQLRGRMRFRMSQHYLICCRRKPLVREDFGLHSRFVLVL